MRRIGVPYLVKPVEESKFNAVFTRAVADYKGKKERAEKFITIKSGDSYHKIFLSEIYYIESQNKKVLVTTKDGSTAYYGRMQDLESVLGKTFFRCHRCYIVNMEHITKYNATTITKKNGSNIFLANKKYNAFVKTYLSYAKSGGHIHD